MLLFVLFSDIVAKEENPGFSWRIMQKLPSGYVSDLWKEYQRCFIWLPNSFLLSFIIHLLTYSYQQGRFSSLTSIYHKMIFLCSEISWTEHCGVYSQNISTLRQGMKTTEVNTVIRKNTWKRFWGDSVLHMSTGVVDTCFNVGYNRIEHFEFTWSNYLQQIRYTDEILP